MGANTLYLSLLLLLLSMMVIGGVGRAWGPLLGAAALMIVNELLNEIVEWRLAGLGLILVVFVMFWPKGLAGGVDVLTTRLRRRGRPIGKT